jgi:hypothetical protein
LEKVLLGGTEIDTIVLLDGIDDISGTASGTTVSGGILEVFGEECAYCLADRRRLGA